jgi:hypothetical protein
MELTRKLFLVSLSLSAFSVTAVEDGAAGNNNDCDFGSNYSYVQTYPAGRACPFGISIGEQRINVTVDSKITGADNSTIEISSFNYNNAVWKTGMKESSTYCMYDMKWIMNTTVYADGSMKISTVGDEWIQLDPGNDVDNVTGPGLYQLKPGAQEIRYNTTEVELEVGGTFVFVKGNIIDLCAAVEDAAVSKSRGTSFRMKSRYQVAFVLLQALAFFS